MYSPSLSNSALVFCCASQKSTFWSLATNSEAKSHPHHGSSRSAPDYRQIPGQGQHDQTELFRWGASGGGPEFSRAAGGYSWRWSQSVRDSPPREVPLWL